MPSRLGGKGVTGCSLSKARWYAANAEGWTEDDDERRSTCHVGARTGGLLYTGVSREEVSMEARRQAKQAWPDSFMIAFAACTRRGETWVLVVQAVPSA
jgi:hypothetical protein